jgi:hypothetical protein
VPISGTDDTTLEDYPFSVERMKPLAGRAREGRANPKGIPYLYLATRRDTAVAEVRPWKGGAVSVGQFRATRQLILVNTSLRAKERIFIGGEPSPEEREESVWGSIDRAFSMPTEHSDDQSEYIPTQVLSEVFRDAGFDGVGYQSAYGDGHNIVLFDPALMQQVNCFIVRVRDIKFTLEVEERFSYTVKRSEKAD